MSAIVVGVGNPVRADDGVGLAVAREVRTRLRTGSDVAVEELWAGGLRLAEALVGHDLAVIIDAMATGLVPPGHVARLNLAQFSQARTIDCRHDTTLAAALAFLRAHGEKLPADIVVVGVEVRDTARLDERLTPEVGDAVGAAADEVFLALGGAG